MKRIFALALLFSITTHTLQAQTAKKLKKIISLTIPGESGSNAGSVVWHPVLKKYYTSMIGNASYEMAIFDAKGKLTEDELFAEYDYRGMWYNPAAKRIEFNCYDSAGWGHFVLDGRGKITDKVIDHEGMYQPDNQAVGVCDATGKKILFLNTDYEVVAYNAKTGQYETTISKIYAGCKTKNEADALELEEEATRWENRNKSCVQYTGLPKAEFAILNTDAHSIELYNQKTGLLTGTYTIPENIAVYPNFNFSYSNGTWWFFNKEERTWAGCK